MTSASIRRSAAADACEYPTMVCAGSSDGRESRTVKASFVIGESEGLIECLFENSLQGRFIASLVGSRGLDRGKLALHLFFDKPRGLFDAERVERALREFAQQGSRSASQMFQACGNALSRRFTATPRRVDHRAHWRQLKVEGTGGVFLVA